MSLILEHLSALRGEIRVKKHDPVSDFPCSSVENVALAGTTELLTNTWRSPAYFCKYYKVPFISHSALLWARPRNALRLVPLSILQMRWSSGWTRFRNQWFKIRAGIIRPLQHLPSHPNGQWGQVLFLVAASEQRDAKVQMLLFYTWCYSKECVRNYFSFY